MISDDLGKQLHDKATRGLPLTPAEQAQLEGWYTLHDQAEARLLTRLEPSPRLAGLQAQVETAIRQLQAVTQRIHELTIQNEAVRQDVAQLHRQLADHATSQAV